MRKIVGVLVIIWVLIGSISLVIWWKVGRTLTPKKITDHANTIARELEIPWLIRFKNIRPIYGADFKVMLDGIQVIAADGTSILKARQAEVRLPWTIFFSHSPVRINIAVSDVNVSDWVRVVREIENFLEARKLDQAQQLSIPQHFLKSTFNLRFARIAGPWRGREVLLSKLYLMNIDPKKPTAFEAVFPWEFYWDKVKLSGETKALGEYRFSTQKIDLHYYLKTRLQLQRGEQVRNGDFSLEGKGFFHPRLGLFSTLTAKDDWMGLVGDVEWTPRQFKWNVPKFSISHEFMFDLLPFTFLQAGTGAYQSASLQGDLQLTKSPESSDLKLSVRTRKSTRVSDHQGRQHPLDLQLLWQSDDKTDFVLRVDEVPWLSFKSDKSESSLSWSQRLFIPPVVSNAWYSPDVEIWDFAWLLPWEKLKLISDRSQPYFIERQDLEMKVTQFKPQLDLPVMGILRTHRSNDWREWTADFEGQVLDNLFSNLGLDLFLVPGFSYTGQIWRRSQEHIAMKLAWRGNAIQLLSRSSCKAIINERSELKPLISGTFSNKVELTFETGQYKIANWQMQSPTQTWDLAGVWSNSPIRCHLQIKQKTKGKKAVPYEVLLN